MTLMKLQKLITITGVNYWCDHSGLYVVHRGRWIKLDVHQIEQIDEVDGLVDGWIQTFLKDEYSVATSSGMKLMAEMGMDSGGVWETFDGVMPMSLAVQMFDEDDLDSYHKSKALADA